MSADFEIIDESEIVSVKRGRKAEVNPELVQLLTSLPKGKAIRANKYAFPNPSANAEEYKKYRAKVSASMRTAGKSAGLQVGFSWSPDGVPQITVTPLAKRK